MVNSIIGRPSKKSVDDTLADALPHSAAAQIANDFNNHFIDSVSNITNGSTPVNLRNNIAFSNVHSAFLPTVDEAELWDIIRSMRLTKSPGFDKIRMRDIAANFEVLKSTLLYILNETLTTGQIHENMKVSIVRPLHKKGSRKLYENYRPISILSSLACILEKIVHANMVSFCDKFSLINPAQYGFRSGQSTIGLLEDFNDHICNEIDKNNVVLTLFVDLQRAFDTLEHELLLSKLSSCGFRGPYYSFFLKII